jgi:hypothetical protein
MFSFVLLHVSTLRAGCLTTMARLLSGDRGGRFETRFVRGGPGYRPVVELWRSPVAVQVEVEGPRTPEGFSGALESAVDG